jgi:hypothetical protein
MLYPLSPRFHTLTNLFQGHRVVVAGVYPNVESQQVRVVIRLAVRVAVKLPRSFVATVPYPTSEVIQHDPISRPTFRVDVGALFDPHKAIAQSLMLVDKLFVVTANIVMLSVKALHNGERILQRKSTPEHISDMVNKITGHDYFIVAPDESGPHVAKVREGALTKGYDVVVPVVLVGCKPDPHSTVAFCCCFRLRCYLRSQPGARLRG